MKKFLAVFALAGAAIFGVGAAAANAATDPSVTKYETEFIYHGEGNWTLVNTGNLTSLHAIGDPQKWLCSYNNVGAGIEPCVPGGSYDFVDHSMNAGLACAYVQADAPVAWDTVPGDPTKAVCLPEPEEETSPPTTSPTPTTSEPPVVTPTPTPSPSTPEITPTSTPSDSFPSTMPPIVVEPGTPISEVGVGASQRTLANTGLHWDWWQVWPLIAGAIAGTVIGILIVKNDGGK